MIRFTLPREETLIYSAQDGMAAVAAANLHSVCQVW